MSRNKNKRKTYNIPAANQQEIEDARNYLNKVPGWLAIRLVREAQLIRRNDNEEHELSEKKESLVMVLSEFARTHELGVSVENYNDAECTVYLTGKNFYVEKNDVAAQLALAESDAWNIRMTESGLLEAEILYTRMGNCLIEI